jgi:pimeloyl-ACP methyl ester carboxylesterase
MQVASHPSDYPTIIYFYGNGQVAAWALYEVDLFRRCGANVLLADYPGYGLSGGKPSESGCYQTAQALWDYAIQSQEIDPHRIVAVGWSLGGAMAIDLASHHPVQGLMTASAFTDIRTVAQGKFWFVPAKPMLHYEFRNIAKIPSISCPTLIVHGTEDTLVPYSMSQELLAKSPAAWKHHLAIPGANHNDVFSTGYEPIHQALVELLRTVNANARHPTTASAQVPMQ